MEPGHANPRAGAKAPGSASYLFHGADDLVAGNHGRLAGRELALDNM
jgi:hypothetical protein